MNQILRLAALLVVLALGFFTSCGRKNPTTAIEIGEIHDAAKAGDVDKVKALIKANPDLVNNKDTNGWPPLLWATYYNHQDVVELLLANKADINTTENDGITPLWYAAARGYTNMVLLLIANGADVNKHSPLEGAIMNNEYGLVPLLLSKGADPINGDAWGNSALYRAALQDSPLLAEILLPYFTDTNNTKYLSKTFSDAIGFGHMDVAVPISTAALRFESNSIFESAFKGDVEGVRSYLGTKPESLNTEDFLGLSPLERAVQGGQRVIAELLVINGADINATDQNGIAPLHWAVCMQQSNIIQLLINLKADLNVKGPGGNTALHLAAQAGYENAIEALVSNNTEVNVKNNKGETPLHVAVANKHEDVADLLRQHGGHE